jgi:hypothetical protein
MAAATVASKRVKVAPGGLFQRPKDGKYESRSLALSGFNRSRHRVSTRLGVLTAAGAIFGHAVERGWIRETY